MAAGRRRPPRRRSRRWSRRWRRPPCARVTFVGALGVGGRPRPVNWSSLAPSPAARWRGPSAARPARRWPTRCSRSSPAQTLSVPAAPRRRTPAATGCRTSRSDVAQLDPVLVEDDARAHEDGPRDAHSPSSSHDDEQRLRVVAPGQSADASRTTAPRTNSERQQHRGALPVGVPGRGLRLGLGLLHVLGLSSGDHSGLRAGPDPALIVRRPLRPAIAGRSHPLGRRCASPCGRARLRR